MRHYLYISDAKIEMLLPQIPRADLNETSHKIGFDLKLLSSSRETKRTSLGTRIAKLQFVQTHIEQSECIGEVSDGTKWFQGSMDAKLVDLGEGAMTFIGRLGDTYLSLGGSAKHLTSGSAPELTNIGASYLPDIAHWLAILDEEIPELLLKGSVEDTKQGMSKFMGQGFNGWANIIEQAYTQSTVQIGRIDFLARRLGAGADRFRQRRYVLSTPLYVSIAE